MTISLSKLEPLLQRIRNRPDSELEQASIRVLITLGVVLYVLNTTSDSPELSEIRLFAIQLLSPFLVAAFAIVFSIFARPGISVPRRIFGIGLDMSGLSLLMATTHDLIVPWYPVYLWVAFGNGLRFGEKYLYISSVLAVIGFSCVLYLNDYWAANLELGLGLLAALIVLPGYAGALTRRITQEKLRAEKANKAKSDFLAHMSHEIRTPLNGIIATGELLKSCSLGEEEREYANTIQNSGNILLKTIENILDISKIEAGKLLIERVDFDLYQLIDDAIKLFSTQAKQRELTLDYSIDITINPRLIGDPLHLRQVLINLVGNALKFTPRGSVHLQCKRIDSPANQTSIRFEIVDTGIGMSRDTQERIFELFTQADESTTRQFGGTGLGTTIAKQLVKLMGGKIGVESKPESGTTFWFELAFKNQPSVTDSEIAEILNDCRIIRIAPNNLGESDVSGLLKKWGTNTTTINSLETLTDLLIAENEHVTAHSIILLDHYPINAIDPEQKEIFEDNILSSKCQVISIQPETASADLPDSLFIQQLPLPLKRWSLFNAIHLFHTRQMQATDAQPVFYQNHLLPLKILVAEDNTINRMVIGRILEKAGHDYSLVKNGQEALSELTEGGYDLVILDMHMPVLGGLDAFKLFRQEHPEASSPPFIMLTANATPEAQIACSEAGIDHFLTKPISTGKLLNIIETLTAKKLVANPKSTLSGLEQVNNQPCLSVDHNVLNNLINLAPNGEFLDELLTHFHQDSLQLLEGMASAIKSGDQALYSDLAHTLKGSAAYLGLLKMRELALDAEKLSPDKLSTTGNAQVVNLHAAYQEAQDLLNSTFANTKTTCTNLATDV